MRRSVFVASGAAAAALLAGSAAFLLGVVGWPEIVTPAWFVSRGLVLYRDIFFPHTPLLIGATALLGGLFGFSAPVLRLAVALPLAATGALLVLGVRSRPRAGAALLACLLGAPLAVLLMVYAEGPALWPEPALAPVLLAAALCLERFERRGSPRALWAGALLLAGAILVKQTSAWAGLAALLWLALASRRRSVLSLATLASGVAIPYALFVSGWALTFRTFSHVRWTLLYLVSGKLGSEIATKTDAAALHEAAALALPYAGLALAALALPAARRFRSPAPWIALGAAGMAWPRFGLLHLAATTGIGALLLVRGLLLLAARTRRARRHRTGTSRLLAFASGAALLLTALGVALFGAAPLASVGGPVQYWDDATTRAAAESARPHVQAGDEMLVFFAPYESLYPVLGTRFPAGVYVNPGFWYCLNKDGVDDRVAAAVAARPGLPVLFREPGEDESRARETALYRVLTERTAVVERVDSRTTWRVVGPALAATSSSRAR